MFWLKIAFTRGYLPYAEWHENNSDGKSLEIAGFEMCSLAAAVPDGLRTSRKRKFEPEDTLFRAENRVGLA